MKKKLILTALLPLIISFIIIFSIGKTYTAEIPIHSNSATIEDINITIGSNVVELTDKYIKDDTLYLVFSAVTSGKTFVEVSDNENNSSVFSLYVHPLGIISYNDYFGDVTGDRIIPICVSCYLIILIGYLIDRYLSDIRNNLYQYSNVKNLGLIIYFSSILLGHLTLVFSNNFSFYSVRNSLNSLSLFAYIIFPCAFIVSILVTISNLKLIKNEGTSWRNMLGCILGILVCIGTVAPAALSEYLQRSTIVDVHNESGAAMYIEMAIENSMLTIITYLEFILIATIILGVTAAKKVPTFDKDYILILGCQINRDGTLTKLLKGRADRAIEFAEMQKKKTGKSIVFVPSGGQGNDEIISEGEAIKRYLLESGIPESKIIAETESVNTFENLGKSMALIKKKSKNTDPNIAFSTTNYHVFRAGIFATQQGIHAEGIGSKTKRYFWVNAFVREFVATLRSEWKTHIVIIGIMLVFMTLMIIISYLSAIL